MNGTLWRSCGKKTRYGDEHAALHMAKKQEGLHGIKLKVYSCKYCGGWHLAKFKQYA